MARTSLRDRRIAPAAMRTGRFTIWIAVVVGLTAAAACSAPFLTSPLEEGAAPTPTARLEVPTPAPEPNVLVVCLAEEPDSFYPFGPRNASARTLLPLLYDGPIDALGYQYSPVLLERLPSIEAGDIRFEPVRILSGDLYFNPDTGLPEEFRPGKSYLPSGCTSMDCRRRYEGGGAELDRLVVDFHLLPGLRWSDGAELTAADSVFAYRVESDPATTSVKDQVNRTSAYEAVDSTTVRWTGIPGFVDPEYAGNFWSPLPEHLLAEIPVGDLSQSEIAARTPIGWGPFQIDSWDPGMAVDFVRNPNYAGASEGLSGYEGVHVRFLEERGDAALQQILTGECDVLEESLVGFESIATLQSLADQGRLRWASAPGPVIERLDFNTAPVDGRPGFFVDSEVRRAVAACLDRGSTIAEIVGGLSPIPSTYLPANHPLVLPDIAEIDHDPAGAADQLTALGWIDDDGDSATPRRSQGARGVPGGTVFEATLATAEDEFHVALATRLAADLEECGIGVRVEGLSAESLYDVWPDGAVFGRGFDFVLWPWLHWMSPACDVFTTAEIPSSVNPQGSNASGYSEAAFDAACQEVSLGPLAGPTYPPAVGSTQTRLMDALPSLPVLQWPRILVYGRDVCGPEMDSTVQSLLWNIEAWYGGEACLG